MQALRPLLRVSLARRSDAASLTPLMKDVWNIDFKGTEPYTTDMKFISCNDRPAQQIFRILDNEGNAAPGFEDVEATWDEATARKAMHTMLKLRVIDNVMYDAQRQGRISFYLTSTMEEAAQIGIAAALADDDDLFPQYREFGCLLWRGYTIDEMLAQHMGNSEDAGKGRQMPVHYGSPKHHWHTVSSPLATQIPHAAGFGYARRLASQKFGEKPGLAVAFFGDGSASEGDFHAGMNFAAVHKSHTLFVCRNNGYAISTPCSDQYVGDGIAARGQGYGIPTIRVDGCDVLAVRAATVAARDLILKTGGPAMMEVMTFRGGHHSTSDDATRYRGDMQGAWVMSLSPIHRAEEYFARRGWWTKAESEKVKKAVRKELVQRIEHHEQLSILPPETLFDDVYAEVPRTLQLQREQMLASIERAKVDPMPAVSRSAPAPAH